MWNRFKLWLISLGPGWLCHPTQGRMERAHTLVQTGGTITTMLSTVVGHKRILANAKPMCDLELPLCAVVVVHVVVLVVVNVVVLIVDGIVVVIIVVLINNRRLSSRRHRRRLVV